jgi:hypothetical protein
MVMRSERSDLKSDFGNSLATVSFVDCHRNSSELIIRPDPKNVTHFFLSPAPGIKMDVPTFKELVGQVQLGPNRQMVP